MDLRGSIGKLCLSVIVLGLTCVALVAPAHAAILTNVSATASSTAPGATNVTYTLTYTTVTTLLGSDGDLLLLANFPSTIVLPTTVGSGCESAISISIGGVSQNPSTLLGLCETFDDEIVLELAASAAVTGGSTVQVTIPGATNPSPFPTAPFSRFQTFSPIHAFDTANPLPTLEPATTTPTAVPTPTLSEWALLALSLMIGAIGYWWLGRQSQERI